jgi:3-hydroxyacyl-[acyl-carrier-protein] dehydratase
MTAVTEHVPPVAAPLSAVDSWHAETGDDSLTITARVGVRGDDPNLKGHFPGLAVFPGVFVIEMLCQVMTLAFPGDRLELRAVRSVRFVAPLLDGDELTLVITTVRLPGGGWKATAIGTGRAGTTTARLTADFGAGEAGDE